MKKVSRYKVENGFLIAIILFAIISITTIFSATSLLNSSFELFYLKQLTWYIVGFGIAYFVMFIGNDFINKHAYIFYGFSIISLLLLFGFGSSINGAIRWFVIPSIGSIQPSEFMKIALILVFAKEISDFNSSNNTKELMEEFKLLLKIFVLFLIPSILTLMQPDTGAVIMYLAITIAILFVSGIRYRWFFFIIIGLISIVGLILLIYFTNQDMFINIFGTSFFYRIDRLLNWSSGEGMQLQNALAAIGNGGLYGSGFNNTSLYFPEPHTDFIFAVFASNYGLVGAFMFLLLLLFFNFKIITLANKTNNQNNKYILAGILGILLYQQIQSVGMTIGLLPITGMTLPFISYGGSSLLSYMIMVGIIFSISNETLRYTN